MIIEELFKQIVDTYSNIPSFINVALEAQKSPYIVIYKTSETRGYTHEGMDTTVVSRFQVSIFDKDYKTVKGYASELYPIGNYTDNTIASITFANEVNIYEDGSKLHHVALDFTVRHNEQIGD